MFVYILFLLCLLLLAETEAEASFQDEALCGLISATVIASKSGYNEWACNSTGTTLTDPCTWTGLTCTGGYVSRIYLYNVQMGGMILLLLLLFLCIFNFLDTISLILLLFYS